MKRIPAVLAIIALIGPTARAGGPATILLPQAQEIQLALEAGPEHLRADATVYVFGRDGYQKIRAGTNGFTCLVNRDGNQGGDNDLKPTCWDAEGSRTIVPAMLHVGELIARSVSAQEIKRDIEAGFASGKFASPQRAGIAYMLRGDLHFDPKLHQITNTLVPAHYMIYAPGVSNADIGMTARDPTSPFALPSVYAGYSGELVPVTSSSWPLRTRVTRTDGSQLPHQWMQRAANGRFERSSARAVNVTSGPTRLLPLGHVRSE